MGAKENFDFIRDLQSVSAKLVSIVSSAVSSATQGNGTQGTTTPSSTLRYDLLVRPTSLVAMLELPGVRKEDIQVTMGSDGVTIVGQKMKPDLEGGSVVRQQRQYGSFTHTIALPSEVELDLTQAEASFADGVLTVTIARSKPETKGPEVHIQIQ
jgi:HSP20 family protein